MDTGKERVSHSKNSGKKNFANPKNSKGIFGPIEPARKICVANFRAQLATKSLIREAQSGGKIFVPNQTKSDSGKKRIAIIRARGRINVRDDIANTMKLINLTRVNHCVVIDNRDQYNGMINKAKDYLTWGEINKEIFVKLIRKRGRLCGNKRLDDNYITNKTKYKSIDEFSEKFINFDSELYEIPDLNPVFRLKPPKKGYERKGIKKPYSIGGVLGYRGDNINELIGKMI